MIRTMLDSDDLAALENVTPFLATYTDIVPDLAALQAQHPHSAVLLIDRGLGDPGMRATLADVESGALTPADLPRWYDERTAAGRKYLTVYNNRNTLPAVIQALAGRPAFHWVATLDGTVHVDGFTPLLGPALVQILGSADLGIHADLSLVLRDDWHPQPASSWPPDLSADIAELRTAATRSAQLIDHLAATLLSAG